LLTIYQPVHAHQGYPKVLHGGVAASLLDEGMARVYQVFHQDPWGMTIDLNIRYIKHMPMTETLYVVSEITKDRSRMYEVKGYITNGKDIYARATATYIKVYVFDQLKSLGYEIGNHHLPFNEIELPE
jgi:acyl-coenzyme A thioesterase PaaI-like protein